MKEGLPVEEVEVRLEVVEAGRVERVLEERRPLVVERELHADVRVAPRHPEDALRHPPQRRRRPLVQQDPRHPRHPVVLVHHPQRLLRELPLEPLLEPRVPHPRPRERVHAHRRRRLIPTAVRRACAARLRDVVRADHRQRAAEAVPRHRHAHVLAERGVAGDEAADLREHLLARGVLAEAAGGVLVGVEVHEAGLHLHLPVRARDALVGDGAEEVHEVGDPLEARDRAAPRDGDVAPAQARGLLVGGDGDVADPVGALAPDLGARARLREEVWEAEVGGGVEVAGHGVAPRGVGHAEAVEEGAARVLAAAAVAGGRVVVEGVVARLRELAVADELRAEQRVHRVEQPRPVVAPVDLPPPRRQLVPVLVVLPVMAPPRRPVVLAIVVIQLLILLLLLRRLSVANDDVVLELADEGGERVVPRGRGGEEAQPVAVVAGCAGEEAARRWSASEGEVRVGGGGGGGAGERGEVRGEFAAGDGRHREGHR